MLENSHELVSDDGEIEKHQEMKSKHKNLQTEGFINEEMEKFKMEDNSYFQDETKDSFDSQENFFSDERPSSFGPESFNFKDIHREFPGDERDDIPELPMIEGGPRRRKKEVAQHEFQPEGFYDFMDTKEFVPVKNVPERSSNFQTSQPFQQRILQQSQPQYEQLREFQPIVGHRYAEPLSYRNPLDIDHNPDDVGFYEEPKFATNHRAFPKSPSSRPLPQFQTPRFLENAPFEDGFLDIPKVGVPSNFFGPEQPNPIPRQSPNNFARPDFDQESIPEQEPPSFVGETPFTEPFFDSPPPPPPRPRPSRQSSSHLQPQYRDLDSEEIYRPKRRPEFQEVEEEFAPMPHLPPPPEMIEMQKNSQFPVDVPKIGANIPYRPPGKLF